MRLAAAVDINYESFQLTCSWLDSGGFYLEGIKQSQKEFERLWNNQKEGLIVHACRRSNNKRDY